MAEPFCFGGDATPDLKAHWKGVVFTGLKPGAATDQNLLLLPILVFTLAWDCTILGEKWWKSRCSLTVLP